MVGKRIQSAAGCHEQQRTEEHDDGLPLAQMNLDRR
jgi:hypothetical protein